MHSTDPAPGTVYLIHFDVAYRHARHYLGWTADLHARLAAHRDGRGARLMEVITKAGITWQLARTWPGGRERERAIKNRHEAPRLCPFCSPRPRPPTTGRWAIIATVREPSSFRQNPPTGIGPVARSTARVVRGARGMVTTLPPFAAQSCCDIHIATQLGRVWLNDS